MAVPEFAKKKLIKPGKNDPKLHGIHGVILHVDAGNASSLFDFFKYRSGGIESHCFVKKDGAIEWYRDTAYEADANHKANSFLKDGKLVGYLSIETQGFAEGEWTDAQIKSIKKIIEWAHKVHGVPYKVCESTFGRGVGYHTLFGSPSDWTPVAKSCPGPQRRVQFGKVIAPWLTEKAKGKVKDAANIEEAKKAIRASRVDITNALSDLAVAAKFAPAETARGKRVRKAQTSLRAARTALLTTPTK